MEKKKGLLPSSAITSENIITTPLITSDDDSIDKEYTDAPIKIQVTHNISFGYQRQILDFYLRKEGFRSVDSLYKEVFPNVHGEDGYVIDTTLTDMHRRLILFEGSVLEDGINKHAYSLNHRIIIDGKTVDEIRKSGGQSYSKPGK